MTDYYLLNEDHSVTGIEDPQEWARAFENRDDRRVARTDLDDGAWVSTVFLGLDHSFGEGPPLIFETMVFQGDMSEKLCWRYSTWEQAEEGHEKAVELAKQHLAAGRPLDEHEDA